MLSLALAPMDSNGKLHGSASAVRTAVSLVVVFN